MAANGCRFAWDISAPVPGTELKARWHVYGDTVEQVVQASAQVVNLITTGEIPPVPARPAPPTNGGNGQPTTCPECGEIAVFIEGVANKNGRPYKAWKCSNQRCPQDNELVPGTFRWTGPPVAA